MIGEECDRGKWREMEGVGIGGSKGMDERVWFGIVYVV